MKATLNFRGILILALPLALLAPGNALAQTNNDTKARPSISKAREIIEEKLDRLRINEVSYDLPLCEVVKWLRDESRKRDPEGNGINFLLNPNPPSHASTMLLPSIDMSQVTVKVVPTLTNVRLRDALDVVVKVASNPIEYSVEDYGVVFSQAGLEAGPKPGFVFSGGTPSELLAAVQQQYGVEWLSVADIPNEIAQVRIPSLRINPSGLDPMAELVSLYNQLGQQRPELGQLVVKGDLTKPSVVMFAPDKTFASRQPTIKVKAFNITGIRKTEWDKLKEDIDLARKEAMQHAEPRSLEGDAAIHKDTSLLVASGSAPFVEMVESIVNAWQKSEPSSQLGAPIK